MADTTKRIIILTALLLVVILGGLRVWSPENEVPLVSTTETTASNIIFRYGSSSGKHPNELDTTKGIFTKDMVNKDPLMTKLDLTQKEMDTIDQMMIEIDFFSYPTTYQPKREGDIYAARSSFTVYSIEYHNETGRKFVYWTNRYTPSEDTQYQNLMKLAHLIIEIIQAKPEYQDLPEPSAAYA